MNAIGSADPSVRLSPARDATVSRSGGWAGAAVAISAGAAIAAAEVGASYVGSIPGAVVDLLLAAVLLTQFSWRPRVGYARILPVLALVALIRPVSLAAAVPTWGPLASYVMAGFPLLAGAVLALRLVDAPAREHHSSIRRLLLNLLVGAGGFPAGVLGYDALRPLPLVVDPHGLQIAAIVVVLLLFGGLLEELVFRGLLQSAAEQVLGGAWRAIAFTAAVSMTLYWGTGSWSYMLLMGGIGCVLGFARARGASLWGVALGHGAMLVTMALTAQQAVR